MARFPNLLDVANSMAPDGSVSAVAEVMHQTNEIFADTTVVEGNLPQGHKVTMRAGIPEPTFRKFYGYVQPDKSERVAVTESVGNLEAYSEIDKDIADLNGNTAEFRMSESTAHIEGFAQKIARYIFFGDHFANPESWHGLEPRFNDPTAVNGEQIIDGGGRDADNASIWLIGWGEQSCTLFYPKGSQMGLQVNDKGQQTIYGTGADVDGRREAYITHFKQELGLAVPDWRYISRIANIKRSALTADAATGANLPRLMAMATNRVHNLSGANYAFYMDRETKEWFELQMAEAVKNSTLTFEDIGGHRAQMFRGIPIRRVDQLNADEVAVPFA